MGTYFYTAYRTLKRDNEQLNNTVKQLRITVSTQREQHKLTEEAYQALSETKLQITRKNGAVIQRIKQAKESDNAPLAPILKQTLEALQ